MVLFAVVAPAFSRLRAQETLQPTGNLVSHHGFPGHIPSQGLIPSQGKRSSVLLRPFNCTPGFQSALHPKGTPTIDFPKQPISQEIVDGSIPKRGRPISPDVELGPLPGNRTDCLAIATKSTLHGFSVLSQPVKQVSPIESATGNESSSHPSTRRILTGALVSYGFREGYSGSPMSAPWMAGRRILAARWRSPQYLADLKTRNVPQEDPC